MSQHPIVVVTDYSFRDDLESVHNVPDYCLDEVADHTLGLILSLTRQIARTSALVKSGQ